MRARVRSGCSARAAASTRSATLRSAISRKAMRFGLRKNLLDSRGHFIGDVYLAGVEPREQIIGRQVDQLDVIGLVEHLIGERFALADAGV